MNKSKVVPIGSLCLATLWAWMAVGDAAIAKPRPKSVRIIYLVSADRTVREDFRKGIETAAKDLQGWYAAVERSHFPAERPRGRGREVRQGRQVVLQPFKRR